MKHSDPMDTATEYEEKILEAALSYRAPEGPAATGVCLDPYCGVPLADGRRWCGPECRDNWEKERLKQAQ